jgi:hypothetical protein
VRDPDVVTAAAGLALGQADPPELGVDEDAVRDRPPGGGSLAAREVGPHDPVVVQRDVRELRTAGDVADGPTAAV